jgi:uncharacterized protein
MRIGILSDTHNNVKNLRAALSTFQDRGVEKLIHCGDMTSPETARLLAGFQVICVFGNGDYASGEIRATLLRQNPENYAGLLFSGEINGARIAVTHGHMPNVLEELLKSGKYDYVFKGHSHTHKDERHGITRLINPGALGGMRREERHICLLDLETAKAEFIPILTD